jgi:hypothetical protein
MRYLKRFNESVDMEALNMVLELKSFTEDCLAYLLDDGLNVEVQKAYKQEGYEISLYNAREFTWIQIKDYYIPFIQLLSNRYEILIQTPYISDYVVKIGANYSGYYHYTYEDIINDRVGVTRFNSIIVRVKEKAKI